ncbi:UNVERIFIED_CONTAM: hypothetical protein HDU68_000688 [Siphonaria sp. JEL0065]|nr:hypothetical protein HDU68_000688 [Siphonaria sp. JEL0065]
MPSTGLGVLSYFAADSLDFDQIPPNAIAVINPNNGVFSDQSQTTLSRSIPQFQEAARRAAARGVILIGHVPTGNANHSVGCNIPGICQSWTNINNQLANYALLFPQLSGIWFDEAGLHSPADALFSNVQFEYAALRQSFYTYFAPKANVANPLLVFNPGSPNSHYASATKKDEIVVIFQNTYSAFTQQEASIFTSQEAADINGAKTWLIVNDVSGNSLASIINSTAAVEADFLYFTHYAASQRGVSTYAQLPSYWSDELRSSQFLGMSQSQPFLKSITTGASLEISKKNEKSTLSLMWRKLRWGFVLFTIGVLAIIISHAVKSTSSSQPIQLLTPPAVIVTTPFIPSSKLNVGILSYWPESSKEYDRIPPGSLALINPNNGIFTDQTQKTLVSSISQYQDLVRRTIARGVFLIGYIPTGNANHTANCNIPAICQSWNNINNHLSTYARLFPELSGIWFDEACLLAPHDTIPSYVQAEYADLRSSFHTYFAAAVKTPKPLLVFNPGTPNAQYPAAAVKDEVVIIFENSQLAFSQQQHLISGTQQVAAANGVKTWVIVNTAGEEIVESVVSTTAALNSSLLYVTDYSADWRAGVNTYGQLPHFWEKEVALIENTTRTNVV